MKKTKKVLLGVWMVIILSVLPVSMTSVNAEEKVIKIGYDANSHFIQEKNNEYYGYGVEYLEKISEYTDWEYEYVKSDSWNKCFDMLRDGTIDIICTAHYTEDRAAEFIYSSIPLGYETTLLYTNKDSHITYKDYDAIAGSKVGLLEGSYSCEDFIDFAEKNQIEYEGIYYPTKKDMRNALENGEIDVFVIGSRYGASDLKLLDRLKANAFYCIANQKNPDLIEEIEDTLQQIIFDSPNFEGNLNEEYFGHNSLSHTPLYTKEELAFIENVGTVNVKMLLNQKPSCYEENGEVRGVWAEYLKLISEKSGIHFKLETGKYDENALELYQDLMLNNYLALRTKMSIDHSNTENVIISSSLMDIDVSYIRRQEAFINDSQLTNKVALTKELSYIEPMLLAEDASYEFVYYDDSESCLEAVKNKKAFIAILTSFRASYLMQKPEYAEKLTQVPGTDYKNEIHLVANEDQEVLISIINKAISHISKEERTAIVTKELLVHPYTFTFDDVWYQYWEWMVGIGVVLVIGLTVYSVLTRRMAKLQIQKKEYEILQKKIQLDELTGLYNRTYFYEIAKEVIEHTNQEMCIVSMDISNFRVVNELYGMNTGDVLLKEIAEKLKQLDVNHKMILARFMSDHYYICTSKEEFEKIDFPKRFKTSLEDMDVRVVYGVFVIEPEKTVPVNVMCDRALIAAHQNKQNYVEYIRYYDNKEHKQVMEQQEIENNMERALEEKHFYIVVQPKYNPVTEKIVGGEALVRWKHPEKGIISPGIFIKIFEKNGFIIHLDYFVWEETCRLISKQKHEGKNYVPISINISRAHFYGRELKNKLTELIEKYDLETKDIELEITESLCGEDPDIIYDKIRELQNMGFKIAMDDFGSGYSSLNMLKEMPLDIIKMDLKFLDGEEKKSRHILKALIDMAHTMELKVVVEGVEILSQVEFLSQFKDCSLQGYYFSRPIVAEEFERMVEEC